MSIEAVADRLETVECERCDCLNVEVEFHGQTAHRVIDAHGQLGFTTLSQTATYLATVGIVWLAEADPDAQMSGPVARRMIIPLAIALGFVIDRITN